MQLHFAPDVGEKDVEVFHRLKLYGDDDPTGQSRKPVVHVSVGVLLVLKAPGRLPVWRLPQAWPNKGAHALPGTHDYVHARHSH